MLTKKTRISSKKKSEGSSAAKPRKQPSQQRSRETVEVILEAAARILESRGLEGYNTNAVAEKAGVSIGSLYQYFPGKDALTVALIQQFEGDLLRSVQDAVARAATEDLPQALRSIVRSLYAAHLRRAPLHILLEAEEQRLQRHIPEQKDALHRLVASVLRPHRALFCVSLRDAVRDCITITRAMVDAALLRGTSSALTERRTVRALCGYLLWQPEGNRRKH